VQPAVDDRHALVAVVAVEPVDDVDIAIPTAGASGCAQGLVNEYVELLLMPAYLTCPASQPKKKAPSMMAPLCVNHQAVSNSSARAGVSMGSGDWASHSIVAYPATVSPPRTKTPEKRTNHLMVRRGCQPSWSWSRNSAGSRGSW
jgi:hypothetical protein